MGTRTRRLNFRDRLLLFSTALVALPMAAIGVVVWQQSQQAQETARQGCERLAHSDLQHIADGIRDSCEQSRVLVEQRLRGSLGAASALLESSGGFHLSTSVAIEWSVQNQAGGAAKQSVLMKSFLGNEDSADARATFVELAAKATSTDCTLYQIMNRDGDMLNVATTLANASGKRLIGTYTPARNADGSANPAIEAAKQGKPYLGRTSEAGKAVLLASQPLHDASGKLVGLLTTSMPEAELTRGVQAAIRSRKVGQSGYAYVLRGQGPLRGHYVSSKEGKRDGEDVWQVRSADGRAVIQEIIAAALPLRRGDSAMVAYPWKNPQDVGVQSRVALVEYFEPWDWVIGVTMPVEEYDAAARSLGELARRGLVSLGYLAAAIGGLVLLVAFAFSTHSMRHLSLSFAAVRASLERVRAASDALSRSSTELSSSSSRQAGATRQLGTSAAEIAARGRRNRTLSGEIREATSTTRQATDQATTATVELATAMRDIVAAGRDISKVLDIINGVALETNLLALNAAVEAARAGESGQGFAVVADGVRALALRCSEAAGETSDMVDRAIASSRRGAELAARVDVNLQNIGERALHLDGLATRLEEDTQAQNGALKQIQRVTSDIGKSGEHSSRSSLQSASVADQLSAQAAELEACIASVEALFLSR